MMSLHNSLLFLLLLPLQIFAQQDSLIEKSYTDLNVLLKQQKDTSLAIAASRAYYLRAKNEDNLNEQLLGLEAISLNLFGASEGKLGMGYIDQAIDLSTSSTDRLLLTRLLTTKGNLFLEKAEYSKAVDVFYAALEEAERTNSILDQQRIINNISIIKTNLEDYEGSRKILQQGLSKLSQIEYIPNTDEYIRKQKLEMAFNANIAKAYINGSNPDSALLYIQRSFEKANPNKSDSCNIRILYYLKTESYLLKNDYKDAKKNLDAANLECLSYYTDIQDLGYLGRIQLGQKKYSDAVKSFKTAIKNNPPEDFKIQFILDYYKYLAQSYKGLGKIDSANFFLEKYILSTNSQKFTENNVATSFRRQEISEFKKELDELSTQKSSNEKILIYGSVAGGLIILVLGFGLVKSHRRRKENEKKFQDLLSKINTAHKPQEIVDTKDEVLEEQTSSDINPETTQQILDGLKKLEEQNYYLHPACSAHNVAKRIKTNTTYLSKVINAEFGKNFSTYINDLRINHAIVRLKQDSKFRSYTISSIATELGYKSADSFTKYFKKDTGLLPSFYIKKLNETT